MVNGLLLWQPFLLLPLTNYIGPFGERMKPNKNTKYICSECGGDNVEEQCWASINTSEVKSIIEGEYWCPDCESHAISIKEVQDER